MADGHPDLRGYWTNSTYTPLERPAALGTKEFYTEAEQMEVEGKLRWEYACGRFSDRSLYVKRKDKEVWSSVRGETNTFLHDPPHLYRTYADKVVDLDGKLLARVRTTEKIWWGEFLPVNEK